MSPQPPSGTNLSALVLHPNQTVNPHKLDLDEYEDFLDALCQGRDYQAEAIRAAISFLLSGNYRSINDLVEEVWASSTAYQDLRTHYDNRDFHEGLLTFPGKLAASLDLATAAGKSYVLYGVARIALNEGVDVRRVLVLVPGKVIREGLREKFVDLLANASLNGTLPPRPNAVREPTLVDATSTLEDGTICIENRDQVYPHVRSSIRPSFEGQAGSDTLVLNDEAHHVYDKEDESKKDATGWFQFLNDPEYGFHRILGVSGTCFTPRQSPYDYFADVLYRYSVKQAINAGYAKKVKNIDSTTGTKLVATSDLYQEAIWAYHQKNVNKYGDFVKPITIIVTQSIASAKAAKKRFVEYVSKNHEANIDSKCLVVSSSGDDAADKAALRDIEKKGSPHEYVFSVSMLTEGWDAKSVFLVVPYEQRAFNSHLLIAQVLGRGLRVPKVEGLPTPILRVFNHTAWAGSVAQIVSDIIDGDTDVPLRPFETQHAPHFTVDYLARTVKTHRETRQLDLDEGIAPDDLMEKGVTLQAQRPNEEVRIVWADTTGTKKDDADTISTSNLPSVDIVAGELYRQLREESPPGSARLKDVEAAGKSAVKAFIRASMVRSSIPDTASNVVSPKNITLLRAGLQRCFPFDPGQSKPMFEEIYVPDVTVALADPISTSSLVARNLTSSTLLDPLHTTFYSNASIAGFSPAETRLFSSLISSGKNFQHTDDWKLRSPVTVVSVSHEPEANFVRELLHNHTALTSWLKSPDQGFYSIPYLRTSGDKSGQMLSFNPDFVLYQERRAPLRAHIYLVEMKAENDTSDKNRDKVAAADQYVLDLNAAVGADRPTYSFHLLAPSDVLSFFQEVSQVGGDEYVGLLHQTLRKPKAEEPAVTGADLDLNTDAWDDEG